MPGQSLDASQPEHPAFDVLVVADVRGGDTGAQHIQPLARALLSAGYTVALMPWFGAAVVDPGAPDEVTEGGVTVAADAPVHARLLIAIDLRLFVHRPRRPAEATAARRMVVVTRGFADVPAAARDVVRNAEEALGGPITLCPAAPAMRRLLQALVPHRPLSSEDWPPLVEGHRTGPRLPERTTHAMVGYFRTTRARPWPQEAALRDVLPNHPLIGLGLFDPPEEAVRALSFGSGTLSVWRSPSARPAEMLRAVDALSCDADSENDPWPEEALEALRHGAIPLLPAAYRGSFLSAALYRHGAAEAAPLIELFSEPDFARDLRAAGRELLDRVLAPSTAVERVEALIGPPGRHILSSRSVRRPPRTILSLSTNGIGMGHLTRQLAIARRLAGHVTPVFLGFSQAVHVVRDFGFVAEYLPFHRSLGMRRDHWNATLADTLRVAVDFYRPTVLLFDGNYAFPALHDLQRREPSLPLIWIRRAMWAEAQVDDEVEGSEIFDLVLEPGEVAGAYDSGPTTRSRRSLRRVAPMTLLDRDELLPRSAAAAELGLDARALNVLLLPGARNNNETGPFWDAVARELGAWPGTVTMAADWAMSEAGAFWPEHVVRCRGYPYSRWFAAFDFAVSAAGYNSFAELMAFGVPTLFVPNEAPLMDRQDLRARFAERNRLGLWHSPRDPDGAARKLRTLRDPATREAIRARLGTLPTANGAAEAAAIVTAWAEAGLAHRSDLWL